MGHTSGNQSCGELTEAQRQEYNRWQGYANALLLSLTVLFAGKRASPP